MSQRRDRHTWPGQDSNLRTTDYESAALTTELPGRQGQATGVRVRGTGMIPPMFIAADLLGLGHSISSFGQTLALAITFLGIGVIANVLIAYAVAQVMAERRENQARAEAYDRAQPQDTR
jgi:hypothetical protein